MFNRIVKAKKESKGVVLSDGKRFNGKSRFTDSLAIKFKIHFAKAICDSKHDLKGLYKRSLAIFHQHYSTNKQPMHDWCDGRCCKYIQATTTGEEYNHNSRSIIPRVCLDLVRPVFDELCCVNNLIRGCEWRLAQRQ
ncbi:unnamed protein product [Adineta ricciae]|uniref:Uncharacterized protein n=1 Tax=Adineta ricciae TaxID=249248 RepID=A0A814MIK5_ADIRI|nr:unnamed protein product [Adineta ricciae]CAF1080255.1 unnamed protein product [Adineta ricciae]